MFLIVGLGNYGRTYEHTRHNAGFDVLEILSRRWGIPMDRRGRKSLYGEGTALGARVILAQPQTYMNLSGDAVVALAQWYHLPPENVIVVFDDVDLPVGRIRLRSGGSAGTHNGMRDIQLKWGKEDFPRVRVGIGRPLPGRDIKDHVLTRVSPDELPAYRESLERAADAVASIIQHGMTWAQDHFNGSPKPEKPARERKAARPDGEPGSVGSGGEAEATKVRAARLDGASGQAAQADGALGQAAQADGASGQAARLDGAPVQAAQVDGAPGQTAPTDATRAPAQAAPTDATRAPGQAAQADATRAPATVSASVSAQTQRGGEPACAQTDPGLHPSPLTTHPRITGMDTQDASAAPLPSAAPEPVKGADDRHG